jgi:hypothetical protein
MVWPDPSLSPSGVHDHTNSLGTDFYRYDVSVGSRNLAAGTYWLGLQNRWLSTTGSGTIRFHWEFANNYGTAPPERLTLNSGLSVAGWRLRRRTY